jgi:serine/threonine protein kinase
MYAGYTEEADLTKAGSLEEVLEIFRRSASSSYNTVASTMASTGDSTWPSVFAMKRRIRRRLLRSRHEHEHGQEHDNEHDNEHEAVVQYAKRPVLSIPRDHQQPHSQRRRLDQSDDVANDMAPHHIPSPVLPLPLPQANMTGSGNDSGAGLAPTMAPQYVSRVPTASPVVTPWRPLWTWLPGYSGGNGPILRIVPGSETFDGYLFIVGAFNNYPAIAIWADDPDVGPFTAALPSKHSVQGFITSIAQVNLPPEATDPSQTGNFGQKDYTLLILVACVMVGIVLGVAFAIGCHSGGYIKVVGGDEEDEEGVGGEEVMGIPLKTLSGGANYNVDFRECFERAMKARHLPTHESLLVINPKEIMLSKIIGEGSFGRVWNGQWRNNSVAVKEFVFAQAAIVGGSLERNNIIEEIVGEAGVMACLRHPKILQLYGCSLTMQAIWIVSEFCSRGSLRMILNDRALDLPFLKKVSICLDVADGMLYLHTRQPPIIHRDIKSHNIFITEPSPGHFVAKIGDWGSARAVALTGAKSMTQGVGTACWLAPEVINFAHSSKDSDVYAFGIVLWEVFTRAEVYEGLSAAQIIAKVANEGLRPKVPRDCPWALIMTECWHQDASQRPGFHRVMTSLSKIYSRAKAASKGRASATSMTEGANTTPSKPKSDSGSGSGTGQGGAAAPDSAPRLGERTPLLDMRSRANSDMHSVHSSISGTSTRPSGYMYSPGGAAVDDIPAPASSSGSNYMGVRTSYFQSSSASAGAPGYGQMSLGRTMVAIPGDQYLTVKQKMPCRISSDPTKTTSTMIGQEAGGGAGIGIGHALGTSQQSKAKSSDVVLSMFSAISESQLASAATAAAAPGATEGGRDTSRLYEFTAIAMPSPPITKDGKKGSRHSSPGITDPLTSSATVPDSGGAPGDGKKPGDSLALKSDGSYSPQGNKDGGLIAVRKARSTRSVFKAEVDVGDGRLSPVEYVILDPGKEHSLDGSLYGASVHGSSDESSAESSAESGKAEAAKQANVSLLLGLANCNSDESLSSPGESPHQSAVPARHPPAAGLKAAAGAGADAGVGAGAGVGATPGSFIGTGSLVGEEGGPAETFPAASSTAGALTSGVTTPHSSGKSSGKSSGRGSETSSDMSPAGAPERRPSERSIFLKPTARPADSSASPGMGPVVSRDRDLPASPLPPPVLSSASEGSSSSSSSGPASSTSPSRGEESRSSSHKRGAKRLTRSRSTSRGRLPQELLAAAAAAVGASNLGVSDKVGQKGGRGPEDGNERDDEAGDSDDDGTGYGTP